MSYNNTYLKFQEDVILMSVYDVLQERGFIAQVSHEEEIREMLEKEKITFYIGFDPTADSLHVGHFIALMAMAHMQRAGHRPIALLGGGTGMIGDPSGKDDMRKMLTPEFINHNIECFKKQMEKFIDFSEGKALMVNNGDWLLNLNYVNLLREVGTHFSVNHMLAAECYKKRWDKGLTFFEFNYMIMQAYDFYTLHKNYNCVLQMGGDDQWSNIIGGVNLIRSFPGRGIRVWGARTISSNGLWKYLNVRRLFIYVEESIKANTNWVVFEPNSEVLWARVTRTISTFLATCWRDGALAGSSPDQAFFVECGPTTMTQDDIDNGRLICQIGIAPVKPAEFVIFRITQKTAE